MWNSRMRGLKLRTYSADPILGTWIKTSSQWRDIIGGKDLDEIQHEYCVLFSLDATLILLICKQACATRASGGGCCKEGEEQMRVMKLSN